jgi:hypothetical protein
VQPNLDVGYSFYVLDPLSQDNPLLTVQFFGFIMVLSGLVWGSRHFLWGSFKQITNALKPKMTSMQGEEEVATKLGKRKS